MALPLLAAPASVQADPTPIIKITGDIRLRLEEDWDSHLATGTLRPDRGRARVRGRLMATAKLLDGLTIETRIRTAAAGSQQNANVTFLDFNKNSTDNLKVSLDRYATSWKRGVLGIDVGRMAFLFFTTNEYMWDADISPLGGAVGVKVPIAGAASLKLEAGGFALPVGVSHYSGHLYAGQALLDSRHVAAAVGMFRFDPDRSDPDRLLLLDDNGSRTYSVLAINTQLKVAAGGKPIAVTADYYRNLQDYGDDPDPISRAYRNQRSGYVLGIGWGDTLTAHHLQLGYRHFRMEKFATNSSYSHDDGARFGTPSQADLTDVKGNDLYANYAVTRRVTVGARTILSSRITNAEDDRRARLDLIYAF